MFTICRLKNSDALDGLLEAPNISVIDLSHNHLEDPCIIDVLEKLPELSVLNLMGNPVIKKIKNYRKVYNADNGFNSIIMAIMFYLLFVSSQGYCKTLKTWYMTLHSPKSCTSLKTIGF